MHSTYSFTKSNSKTLNIFEEAVLDDFFTSNPQDCFFKCTVNLLCIGQNIYQMQNNVYRCIMFTITDHVITKEQNLVRTLVN